MVKNSQEILNHADTKDFECKLTALRGQDSLAESKAQGNGREMADFE